MSWYALQTHPNHEKSALTFLEQRGIAAYLPLVKEKRRWSDRKKEVEFPLFRGYLFVSLDAVSIDAKHQALSTPGIARFVTAGDGPAIIPDSELDLVRQIVDDANSGKLALSDIGSLVAGCTVEIMSGAMYGHRGTFEREKPNGRLVVSIADRASGRKVSAELNPHAVKPLPQSLQKAA